MTMRSALRTSSNRAVVQMLGSVGIPKAVSYAEKLNVGKPPAVPSLALGASDVTLAALTAAYGAFADGGIVRTPILIRRVEDSDGAVLYQEEDKSHRAVSEATAFLMASMLSDVINAGTAFRARQNGFTLPAAGKTGTTNDYNDAWFVGFTPHLVAGVWVGFDQPQTIASGGYAGELAVPIWGAFMKRATRGDKPDWFPRPANVVGVNVCRMSGKLPAGGCDSVSVVDRDGQVENRSMVYTDYFVRGTEPTTLCPLHSPSFSDRLAGVFGKDSGMPVAADACRPAAAGSRQHFRQPGFCHRHVIGRSQGRQGRGAAEEAWLLGTDLRPRRRGKEKEGRRGAEEGKGRRAEAERCAQAWWLGVMPFRDIAGHRHLLELVSGAIARQSLPPSLIFAGPRGVGKRTAAAGAGAGPQLPRAGARRRTKRGS